MQLLSGIDIEILTQPDHPHYADQIENVDRLHNEVADSIYEVNDEEAMHQINLAAIKFLKVDLFNHHIIHDRLFISPSELIDAQEAAKDFTKTLIKPPTATEYHFDTLPALERKIMASAS